MLRIRRGVVALGLISAAIVAIQTDAAPVRAVTVHTVTTTDDTVAFDADLSLREAFTAANTDGDDSVIELGTGLAYILDLCPVVPAHTINDAGSLVHTATDDLTINGNGSTVTQTCADERVVRSSDDMAEITLNDITLTGGQVTEIAEGDDFEPIGGGGGLLSFGPATLNNVTLTGNTSLQSGGGLRALVATNINGGSITGNTSTTVGAAGGADIGSGFSSAVPFLTMVGTTVTGNDPHGMTLRFGSNTITNSTISANLGRGVFADHGNHDLIDSTVDGNGGGGFVAIDGDVDLTNTTVTGNGDVGVTTTGSGDFTVLGGSINDNVSHAIDFIGCNATEGQDNIVLTNTLLSGNGGWGINHQGCGNTIVTTTTISNNAGGVRCSGCENVTVEFSTIIDNMPGSGIDFLPGFDGAGGALLVRATQITDNMSDTDGGGIRARESFDEGVDTTVTVSESSSIAGNTTTGRGGGIFAQGSTIVFGSVVSNNSTAGTFEDPGGEGGGIYVSGGDLSVTGGAVQGNMADASGGGISHRGAGGYSIAVSGTPITSNQSAGQGGGIFTWSSDSLTVVAAEIAANSSVAQGGGITALDTAGLIAVTTIDGNQASAVGGGVYYRDSVLPGDPLIVFESTISNNTAPAGGGIFGDIRSPAGVEITNSTVSGNTTNGVQTSLTTPITLDSATIVDNGPNNIMTEVGALLTTTQSVIALADGGSDCFVSLATSNGHNFSGDGTCGLGLGVGDVSFGGDPTLGPLQDNGGPTETHEPLGASPLLSMVPAVSCAQPEDQRGEIRPGGTGCEPGSVEVGIALALPGELTTLPGFPDVIDVLGALPLGIFDAASLRIVGAASSGRAEADSTAGVVRYTAALDFEGTDRFSYEICRIADPDTCEQAVVVVEVTLGAAPACTIIGTDRGEVIFGTRHDDVICALGGRDLVIGRGGDDLIIGGDGRDLLIGSSGDDQIVGGNGRDILKGKRGFDELVGGSGFDACWVGSGGGTTVGCERPRNRPQ